MDEKTMEKVYQPSLVEGRLYAKWEEKGYFHAKPNPDKKPYTIVIPPPNITGQLHMGHALDNMMQDALIRFKRMQGFEALWMPGTDHASIATEVKIIEQLARQGVTKKDLGREGFLEKAWDWRAEYGGKIVEQLKRLGSSCDWARERFTMDEGCSRAVREVFIRLYEKGLIYRGSRIINWCPDCKTALSDAEVEYEENKNAHLWHIRYPAPDGGEGVVVATTRPETMLGDMAVAVNPKDERYRGLIGKTVRLPLTDREIPVIADEYVEMEFGTGAVKITPAHDPNDFEVALRHDLPVLRVMNDDGTMNEAAGSAYQGMDRFDCRKKAVADLKQLGLLVRIEGHLNNVGHCYRCHTVCEPIASKQWFVRMKPLAEPAIQAVREGQTRFVPERFEKIYFNWLENIRDWCISRQLWWGHRIPAYYCQECSETVVAAKRPGQCPKCGGREFVQDEDVLDTWFSSALWPFSTLGWPERTPELAYFYPTDVLVTAYDIIFFWVARMIFSAIEHTGQTPFHTVLIHGIVRDAQGRKMSKSLGNGIDPLEIIDQYGADALRFSLAVGTSPGNDMRFYLEKVESARNFANKIWNAARFVQMNIDEGYAYRDPDPKDLDMADKWILDSLNGAIGEITENLERYELGLAAQKVYDFIWSSYCDWYIELSKHRLQAGGADKRAALDTLIYTMRAFLKLLHPLMPFITEEVYGYLPGAREESIMIDAWPTVREEYSFNRDARAMQGVMEIIRTVRNVRAEMNVPVSRKARVLLLTDEEGRNLLGPVAGYLTRLAYASEVSFIAARGDAPKNAVSASSAFAEAFLPLQELVDVGKEIERAEKEMAALEREIENSEKKLANQGFVSRAPAKVVEEERARLKRSLDLMSKVKTRVGALEEMG